MIKLIQILFVSLLVIGVIDIQGRGSTSRPSPHPSPFKVTTNNSISNKEIKSDTPPISIFKDRTIKTKNNDYGYSSPTLNSGINNNNKKEEKTKLNSPYADSISKSSSKSESRKSYKDYVNSKPEYKKDRKSWSNKSEPRVSTQRPSYLSNKKVDPKKMEATRNTYYVTKNYNPPIYAQQSYSHFGAYDAMFMWMMLDNMNHASHRDMMYNHQRDPEFQEWKREADRLAKDDDELNHKLILMEREMDKLKAQNKPVDPNYIPKDIPADVILAQQSLSVPEITTGDKTSDITSKDAKTIAYEKEFEKINAKATAGIKEKGSIWTWIIGFLVLGAIVFVGIKWYKSSIEEIKPPKYRI